MWYISKLSQSLYVVRLQISSEHSTLYRASQQNVVHLPPPQSTANTCSCESTETCLPGRQTDTNKFRIYDIFKINFCCCINVYMIYSTIQSDFDIHTGVQCVTQLQLIAKICISNVCVNADISKSYKNFVKVKH